jgi:NAD(P)-dependent dehydrogenase (short-subunit alcohol dehydrogenase family)
MPDADPSRWVPPRAIAEVIAWLASPEAWPVSGAAIPVYGDA